MVCWSTRARFERAATSHGTRVHVSIANNHSNDLGVSPGEVLLGKYRVDQVIGRGGMGVVVEAWHLQLEERVAIKLLLPELVTLPEAVARFQREGRALFKIKSEHVCRVFDIGTLGSGVPFMVMEFLQGDDLAALLASRRRFSLEEAIGLIVQACFGVAEAHRRGVVHRDLKPENLFVCQAPDGEARLKLLDFGLSKERERPGERKRALTQKAQVMGTPHYMAPEQWMSAKDVGATADQWALGVMLYEMLAGGPPFDGEQLAQICSQTLNAPTPSLRDVRADLPAEIDPILHKCLEKDPRHRYENVGALAVALSPFAPLGTAAKAEGTLRMLREAVDVIEDSTPMVHSRAPLAPSDMQVTVKRPPQIGDLAQRVRSVTAQSWNSGLRHAATRSRWAVGLGVLAIAAMVVVSVAILGQAGEETTSRPAGPTPATAPTVAAPAGESAAEAASAAEDDLAPSAATVRAAPQTSASASATTTTQRPPAATARPPAPRPLPKRPPSKHGDLFEDRY